MKKKKPPHIVLVCGGRDFDDSARVHRVLFKHHEKRRMDYLIHGDCPTGADKYASAWSKVAPHVQEVKVPAMWGKNGKGGGPVRNRAMANLVKIDKVIAFPGGGGTADMVKVAKQLGIKVVRVKSKTA